MAFLPLRTVDLSDTTRTAYDTWLDNLAAELANETSDRYDLCRRVLTDIYYPQYRDTDPATLPEATRMALLQMDPR
ncbi:MAG: hypothetical protein ABIS27_14370, partial [Longimicrobiales bacterium]